MEVDDVQVEIRLTGITHSSKVMLIKFLVWRFFRIGEIDFRVRKEVREVLAKSCDFIKVSTICGRFELLFNSFSFVAKLQKQRCQYSISKERR